MGKERDGRQGRERRGTEVSCGGGASLEGADIAQEREKLSQ